MWDAEPEITIHGCPDKVSDQIIKCSDILKYGQTLLQCMQINPTEVNPTAIKWPLWNGDSLILQQIKWANLQKKDSV